uniref:Uncharacterized protein n=1 Tax=Acanthochromis polyacanthus TaxID=80966 RepID=A0A3Q1F5S8_9TELE
MVQLLKESEHLRNAVKKKQDEIDDPDGGTTFQLDLPPDNVRVYRRASIMVWGCMSAADDHLTVCDDTVNSAMYCAILKTHMLPSACVLFPRGQNMMFQQDNQYSTLVLEWPVQSPELLAGLQNTNLMM